MSRVLVWVQNLGGGYWTWTAFRDGSEIERMKLPWNNHNGLWKKPETCLRKALETYPGAAVLSDGATVGRKARRRAPAPVRRNRSGRKRKT